MSPTSPIICTHDRGRGTTVCLRCRHDEWQASQKRRQQMLMRFFGLVSVVGIIGIAGAAGAITLRGGGAASVAEPGGRTVALRQEGHSTNATPVGRGPHTPRPLMPTPARSVPPDEPAAPPVIPPPPTPPAAAPTA